MLIKMGQTGSGKRWTMDECKDELARRVGLSLRSGPNARVRAFQVFKRGGTRPVVRLEDFTQGIQKYNMIIPAGQAEELFNSYDQKGLGASRDRLGQWHPLFRYCTVVRQHEKRTASGLFSAPDAAR